MKYNDATILLEDECENIINHELIHLLLLETQRRACIQFDNIDNDGEITGLESNEVFLYR